MNKAPAPQPFADHISTDTMHNLNFYTLLTELQLFLGNLKVSA